MKRLLYLLFVLGMALSACGTSPTQSAPPAQTSTPSLIPTRTQTPIPRTSTVTPLPAIPTFTPTFDVSTIVTVTPAEKAGCPAVDPTVKPEDFLPSEISYPTSNVTNEILEYLNKGGDGQNLVKRLDQIYSKSEYHGGYGFLDVTGDQISELLYVELNYVGKPLVFSCKSGKFETLAALSAEHNFSEYTMNIDDLNANGIPEIIIIGTDGVSFAQSQIYIFEWDGQTFQILGTVGTLALNQTEIKDLDGNGTKEIMFSGDTSK